MKVDLGTLLKQSLIYTYSHCLHIYNKQHRITVTVVHNSAIRSQYKYSATISSSGFNPLEYYISAKLPQYSENKALYNAIINSLSHHINLNKQDLDLLFQLKDTGILICKSHLGFIYHKVIYVLHLIMYISNLVFTIKVLGINIMPQSTPESNSKITSKLKRNQHHNSSLIASKNTHNIHNKGSQSSLNQSSSSSVIDWNTFVKTDLSREEQAMAHTHNSINNSLSDITQSHEDIPGSKASINSQGMISTSSDKALYSSCSSVMPHEMNIHKSILGMNLSHEASSADAAEAQKSGQDTPRKFRRKSGEHSNMTNLDDVIRSHMSNDYDDRPKITRHGKKVIRIPHQYYKLYNSNSRAMHYILGYIKGRDYITTSNVAKHLKLNFSTVSQGLKILANHGFISKHRNGNNKAPRRAYYGNIKYQQPDPHSIWHRSKKGNE